MSGRLSFDDSALFCTWERDRTTRPLSLSDDQLARARRLSFSDVFPEEPITPTRPRAPSPDSMFRYSDRPRPNSPQWTLHLSPLQQLESISVDSFHTALDGIPIRPHHSRRASTHSISVSSTCSEDSLSSLISNLDQSIASWSSESSTRTLRKKGSPKRESLRDIRTKQSEAQLQLVYEQAISAYLDDSIFDDFKPMPLQTRVSF